MVPDGRAVSRGTLPINDISQHLFTQTASMPSGARKKYVADLSNFASQNPNLKLPALWPSKGGYLCPLGLNKASSLTLESWMPPTDTGLTVFLLLLYTPIRVSDRFLYPYLQQRTCVLASGDVILSVCRSRPQDTNPPTAFRHTSPRITIRRLYHTGVFCRPRDTSSNIFRGPSSTLIQLTIDLTRYTCLPEPTLSLHDYTGSDRVRTIT